MIFLPRAFRTFTESATKMHNQVPLLGVGGAEHGGEVLEDALVLYVLGS